MPLVSQPGIASTISHQAPQQQSSVLLLSSSMRHCPIVTRRKPIQPHLEQLHELVVGEGVEDDNVGHPTIILPVRFVDRRKVAETLVLPLAPPAPKHAAQDAPLLLRLAVLHIEGKSCSGQYNLSSAHPSVTFPILQDTGEADICLVAFGLDQHACYLYSKWC